MKTQTADSRRSTRSPEDQIAALQKKIEAIKVRAERRKVRQSPALRHVRAAIKSLDKARSGSEDPVLRKALDEARTTLTACLSLTGVLVPSAPAAPRARRNSGEVSNLSENLLEYVLRHPGQRGEQIASALSTDVITMRRPMKALIASKKVKTQGVARGTTYHPA